MRVTEWTPDHWLMVLAFFAVLGLCVFVLIRAPTVRLQGIPPHDLSGRMQLYISEIEQRVREMPKPREVRELAERIGQLERTVGSVQSDVRAGRESSVRVERQINILIEAGLEREGKGTTT